MTVLVNLLKAHVIEGKVMSTMIKDNLVAPTLVKGVPMRINVVTWWQVQIILIKLNQMVFFKMKT